MIDNTAPAAHRWRQFVRAAAVLLCVYAVDVIAGKAAVVLGFKLPFSLGDVGEFLIVLLAMICFVTGILGQETQEADDAAAEDCKA